MPKAPCSQRTLTPHVFQLAEAQLCPAPLDTPPSPYATLHQQELMSTSALSLSDGTKTGPKGQKQGRKDFTKGPCLPKLDLFPPSFGQGPKGPKGRNFQKLLKLRKQRHPVPRYGVGHDSHPTGAEAHPEPSRREPDPLTAYCRATRPSPLRRSLHPLRLLPQLFLLVE